MVYLEKKQYQGFKNEMATNWIVNFLNYCIISIKRNQPGLTTCPMESHASSLIMCKVRWHPFGFFPPARDASVKQWMVVRLPNQQHW